MIDGFVECKISKKAKSDDLSIFEMHENTIKGVAEGEVDISSANRRIDKLNVSIDLKL